MKPALRTALLCAALLHPLVAPAQAAAQPVPPETEPAPSAGSSETFSVVLAGMAGSLLLIPGVWAGALIGDRVIPRPTPSCDPAGCDTGYHIGPLLGAVTFGFLGAAGGSGLGVAIGGSLVGGRFHWWPAVLGGAVGSVLGGVVSLITVYSSSIGQFAVPLLTMAGAVTGAFVAYNASAPWPQPPVEGAVPVVTLLPGGGVAVGVTGRL